MITPRQYIPRVLIGFFVNPVPGAAAQIFGAAAQVNQQCVYFLVQPDPTNTGKVTIGGSNLQGSANFGITLVATSPPVRIDAQRQGDVWIVDEAATGTQKLRVLVFT